MTVSLKPMLGDMGTMKDSHLLLAAVPKSVATKETWDVLWSWIAWSFTCLFEGVHPERDPNGAAWPADHWRRKVAGEPIIAGGYKCVLWGLCGDLEYFSSTFGTPYHASASFCWRCQCNRSTTPWTDFRASAAWRRAIFSAADVMQQEHRHAIFKVPGVSRLSLMLDVMRTMEKGVTAHTIACCLFTLVYDGPRRRRGEATPQEKFNQLWLRIQVLSKELGLKDHVRNFTLAQICKPERPHADYPCLGSSIKAAETRRMVPAIAKLVAECEQNRDEDRHRTLVMQALAKFYDILEAGGRYLGPEAPELVEAAETFLSHYSWLASRAMAEGRLLWSITPKFHLLHHLAQQGVFENPSLYWVYSGEDFVGRISRIAHMCSYGKAAYQVTLPLAERYAIGLHIRLRRL